MIVLQEEMPNVAAKLNIIEDMVFDLETETYVVVRSNLIPENDKD